MREVFRKLGDATAQAVGTPLAFLLALAVVVVWAFTGPAFAYSDTWQLIINTGTTIVTFLMVFLIQGTQTRDTRILNLKLDELLRALEGARTGFVSLNDMSDADLEEVQRQFSTLADKFGPLLNDDLANVRHEIYARKSKGQSSR